MIGILTAVTGDLASHFGCTVGLADSVVAISFVALGTSLPGKHPFKHLFTCVFQYALARQIIFLPVCLTKYLSKRLAGSL